MFDSYTMLELWEFFIDLETWEPIVKSVDTYLMPVLVAALSGGLIGVEREYRDKSAGLRTMILIAIGSCLFTLLSEIIGTPGDETTRIAAAVVTGVGFLGAGVVMKDGFNVGGITTAAVIWLVAALGMGAAVGEYFLVLSITAIALAVLWFLSPLERWLDRLYEFLEVSITIKNTDTAEDNVLDIFDECKIKVVSVRRSRVSTTERTIYIKAKLTPAKRQALSEILVNEKAIIAFDA